MKVGDYVRTEDGIKKVLKYTYNEKYKNGNCVWFDNKDNGILFTDEEVNKMKPSPNIIDLIEAGDYVNGLKVSRIGGTYHGRKDKAIYCDYCVDKETGKWIMIYDDEIKSIVTKEQFKSVEYKIGVDKE